MKVKVSIALPVICLVLSTTTGILYALEAKWVLTAMLFFGALCWLACAILNYKTLKRRGY